ncbi:hypothetical protein OIU83_17730 [Flavobacterium sp. LS1R49]|uniref:Uncharacterized protein n=1 Tax=Flavobacterium shii TaxID=2987687 RepID=A0A9X2ZDR8_9FLAO|nr:hypothetical protein [Flavobacterium shii]MCV9929506.1 hypothetical protein [Flavobacterium shii]
MIVPILELYRVIEAEKAKFETKNLNGNFFIDLYRSQPVDPELYEYYSLPALFVNYTNTGQGKDKPRLIQMTLHLVIDEEEDASNVAPNKVLGMNRFIYVGLLQEILEGRKLGTSSPLKFISEVPVDNPVADYHILVFEFESYARDLIETPVFEFGEFETLDLKGKLKQKKEAD